MKSLVDIPAWSHRLLAEVLAPGDLGVDLTAGNGRDTLFLAGRVAPHGQVVAFDVQETACRQTAAHLQKEGVAFHAIQAGSRPIGPEPGVWLVADCHSRVQKYLPRTIKAAVANLGYLPGGDKSLTTRTDTTLAALSQVLESLEPGGRLCVVIYVGHGGGREEGERVIELFAGLSSRSWEFMQLEVGNRCQAPRLLVVQKRRQPEKS